MSKSKGKSKKVPKDKSKKVPKDKSKSNEANQSDLAKVSAAKVKVKIYSRFGSDTRHKRAEFFADETRDEYGNPVVKNVDFHYDEDIGFKMDQAYSAINTTLRLDGKSHKKKIDLLEKDIDTYSKRVAAITKHPELNALANIWDEKRHLRELQIFKKYTENRSEQGSYYKMEDGYRLYEYESIDGFLMPIWHGCDNLTDWPNYTTDKKITMQETAELKTFLDHKKKTNIKYGSLFFLMIILGVMVGFFLMASLKAMSYHNEAVEQWEAPAEYCSKNLAEISGAVTNLFSNDVVRACLMTQNKTASVEEVTSKIKELSTDK